MKAGQKINVEKHYELINLLLDKGLKGHMKSTYEVNPSTELWLIRLNNKQGDCGWTNMQVTPDVISEVYTADKSKFKPTHKLKKYKQNRLIFEVVDKPKRHYIFKGMFTYTTPSDDFQRVWKKTSDTYEF